MVDKGFNEPESLVHSGHKLAGKSLDLLNLPEVPYFDKKFTIKEALKVFESNENLTGIPIVENNKVVFVVYQ